MIGKNINLSLKLHQLLLNCFQSNLNNLLHGNFNGKKLLKILQMIQFISIKKFVIKHGELTVREV
jgi:hypothetical protein